MSVYGHLTSPGCCLVSIPVCGLRHSSAAEKQSGQTVALFVCGSLDCRTAYKFSVSAVLRYAQHARPSDRSVTIMLSVTYVLLTLRRN